MSHWSQCHEFGQPHDWGALADGISHRCKLCGAAGYKRQLRNPHNHQLQLADEVHAYRCSKCGGPTKAPRARCPDCAKALKKNGWSPTARQEEILAQLGEGDGPVKVEASGATLGVLRKKGLVKQVSCWQITDKGREFLAGNSCNQEDNEDGKNHGR